MPPEYFEKIDSTISAGTINTMLITCEMKMSVPFAKYAAIAPRKVPTAVARIAAMNPIRSE